jgi:hypothetical protein
MNCHVRLFLCYPAALLVMLIAGALTSAQQFSLFSLVLCLAYYAMLLSALFACSHLGGWVRAFYGLAVILTCLNSLAVTWLQFHPAEGWTDTQAMLFSCIFFSMLGVYVSCSLAGAAIAARKRKCRQAIMQVLWPVSFLFAPLLGTFETVVSGPGLAMFCLFAYLVQGLQAMFLAMANEQSDWTMPLNEPPAIGWEVRT